MDTASQLFANQREINLRSVINMIEVTIVEMGHILESARVPGSLEGGLRRWRFRQGSATIHVHLLDRHDFTHLRVVAPVMILHQHVDTHRLYRRLLALNDEEIYGAAFAAQQDTISLVAERSTLDIDRSEVLDLIQRVADYADNYAGKLVGEFGGLAP